MGCTCTSSHNQLVSKPLPDEKPNSLSHETARDPDQNVPQSLTDPANDPSPIIVMSKKNTLESEETNADPTISEETKSEDNSNDPLQDIKEKNTCKDDQNNKINQVLRTYLKDRSSSTPTVNEICINGCEAGYMHHMPTNGKVMPNEDGTKLMYNPTSTFSCSILLCTRDKKKTSDPDNIRILFVWCKMVNSEYKWYMGSPFFCAEGREVNFIPKEITSDITSNSPPVGINLTTVTDPQGITNKLNQIRFNNPKCVWSRSGTENNFQIFKMPKNYTRWYWKAPGRSENDVVTLTKNSGNMAHFNFIQT